MSVKPTPSRDFGPFFVLGAPYRAKLSPIDVVPLKVEENSEKPKPGEPLRVRGKINALDKESLIELKDQYITIDLWQASPSGFLKNFNKIFDENIFCVLFTK